MSDVVLWLNMSKCMVYTRAREVPAGIEDEWEQGARHDGLLITGRQYSVDNTTLDTDAGVIGTVFPVGDQKFRADFANSMRDKIVAAWERMEQSTERAEGCRQQDSPQTSCSNTLSPPRCLLAPPITQNLVHTVEAHVIRSVARISYFTQEELNARNEQIPLSLTKVWA